MWATLTTCRGRCGHSSGVPTAWVPLLAELGGSPVVVSWGCSGRGCVAAFRAGGGHVADVPRHLAPVWRKCDALAHGVEFARSLGASRLLLVDADARPGPGLGAWLSTLRPGELGLAGRRPDGSDLPGATGFAAFELSALDRAGGIPRGFDGYGQEDIAIRLALAQHGATPRWAPWGGLAVIEHSQDDRRQEYPPELRDLTRTNRHNRARLLELAAGWPGGLTAADPLLRELDFRRFPP